MKKKEKTKKIKGPKFFKRLKDSIFNFDEYKSFVEEKLSISIKYIFKLAIVIALILTIGVVIKYINNGKKAIQIIKNDIPNFKIEEHKLFIDGDKKQYIIENEYYIVLDEEKTEISDIKDNTIALLSDRILIYSKAFNINVNKTYKDAGIGDFSKQSIISELQKNKTALLVYGAAFVILVITVFYLVLVVKLFIDILFLSFIGFLVSRIIDVRLNYRSVFNLSTYSLTLPIILYTINWYVLLFTDFNIVGFNFAYNAISYVYLMTAFLIIRSDIIKQNIELRKIISEQKKIHEEQEAKKEEEKRKEEEKKEDKPKKQNKQNKKNKEKENGQEPEGNQA